jgi:hypothetical protein
MTIKFVGGRSVLGSDTSGTTVNIPLNSGLTGGIESFVRTGDMVIVVHSVSSTSDVTLTIRDPSSVAYTLIGSELYSNDTYDTNLRVAYKFMGATPDASVSFSDNLGGTNGRIATAYVLRGVNSTTPLDVAAVTATNIDTGNVDPPSITPVTSGAAIVVFGAAAHNLGGVFFSFPSGSLYSWIANSNNTSNDSSHGVAQYTWTSGAFNPAAWTLAGTTTTDSWASITVALRPATRGNIKYWNGTAWTVKPVKVWNGSAWVTEPVNHWNGSIWIETNY